MEGDDGCGKGGGVPFGTKKLLLRVLFSTSRSYICEPKLGINEMRIFSSFGRRDVRAVLCLQTKAVNVSCLE